MKAVVLILPFTGGVNLESAKDIVIPVGVVENRDTVLLYPKYELTVTTTCLLLPCSIVILVGFTEIAYHGISVKVGVGNVGDMVMVCGDNLDEETGELNIIKVTTNKIVIKCTLVLIFLAISLISV